MKVYERAFERNGFISHDARLLLDETADTVTYQEMYGTPDGTCVETEQHIRTVSRREWKQWAKLARLV